MYTIIYDYTLNVFFKKKRVYYNLYWFFKYILVLLIIFMFFYLNSKKIQHNVSLTVLQALERANESVPRFCYHQKLSIAANCRMCLVQTELTQKPVASCAITISENLKIITNSSMVKKARESVLEFLLINHPLDCPICDQGGECDLQDQTLIFGNDRGRFYETKRAVFDLNFGAVIKTFMTRCIHCTRCIRFVQEVVTTNELGVVGRGNNTRISTFLNKSLKSNLSGNLADVCPVGALTAKPYAFVARPWEIKSYVVVDIFDSFGENLRVDLRGTEVLRILPCSEDFLKNEWISNKSRFFFDGLKKQRLSSPAVLAKSNQKSKLNSFKLAWQQVFFVTRSVFQLWLLFFRINETLLFKEGAEVIINLGALLSYSTVDACRFLFENFFFKIKLDADAEFSRFFKPLFKTNFLFSIDFHVVQHAKIFIGIGLNLLTESPLLKVKLNAMTKKKHVVYFSMGACVEKLLECHTYGVSSRFVVNFLKGHLGVCRSFKQFATSDFVVILCSTSQLLRVDSQFFGDALGDFKQKVKATFVPIIATQTHVYEAYL